ncbi:IucA/IucC family protein [Embleya sp. AB8]|uniref:IucA/IucC family protein n=1 Tax=Embleya sp. AB8 TaxID=3156304 RepID=UPI003C7850E4
MDEVPCSAPQQATSAVPDEFGQEARRRTLDRLVSALVREELLDLEDAERHGLAIPVRQVTAAGRLVVDGVVALRTGAGTRQPITEPVCLVDVLVRLGLVPVRGLDWAQVRSEIAAGVEGHTLALDGAARQAGKMRAGGEWDPKRPFTALLDRLPAGSPLVGFEQLVVDGHPLHPAAMSRLGMSAADVLRYAPEFGAAFALPLVAVAREAASGADGRGGTAPGDRSAGPAAAEAVLSRAIPGAVAAARAELADAGYDPDRYILLPVHPHQRDHALPRLHGDALTAGLVVPLAVTVPARPLLSTRTLAVREPGSPAGLHIKTALEVQITSAVRGVSVQAVRNGPRLSVLLEHIAAEEHDMRSLTVCREQAGVCFVPVEQAGADASARRRSLGAVLREDPETLLAPGEVVLPIAALLARSPLTGRTILHDVVTEPAGGDPDMSGADAVERWLRHYLELIVPPTLTLLTRYGIALEAHSQNTLLALRGGLPSRVLIRDLGSVRILAARLARSGHTVMLAPGSALYASDADTLRSKLYFALFGHQLGELVPALAEVGGCPEQVLWPVVRDICRQTFIRLTARALGADAAADACADALALLEDPWPVKGLLRMRLTGQVTEQPHFAGPNPLRRVQGEVEAGVLAELRAHDPDLAIRWLTELDAARRDTAQDLLAALRREGLVTGPHGAADRPEQVVDNLRTTSGNWTGLRAELADSAANLALSRAAARRRREVLRATGAPDPLSTVPAGSSPSDVTLALDALETEGHALHPCRRTRLGFSTADVLAYTPESGATVRVEMVAVHRGSALETAHEDGRTVGDLLAAAYPALTSRAVRGLRERGYDPDAYVLVPVHPWQARNVLPSAYDTEIAAGLVVRLPEAALACRPTSSIRTLVTIDPGRDGERLTLKLALDVQLTGGRRTISPATTRNSPRLGPLLRRLLAAEPRTTGRVDFVPELAGVAFDPPEGPSGPPIRHRGLSALLRPDPAGGLRPGETMVSGVTLLARSPVTGHPLLTDVVNARATADGIAPSAAALAFLREYGDLLCSAALPLLWRHGIAIEAHLQNTLLVLRRPDPIRLVLRDSGGLRLHPGRFGETGSDFTPHPGSLTVTEHIEEVRAKLCHAVIHANLGILIDRLRQEFRLPAPTPWDVVRAVVEEIRADVSSSATPGLAGRVAQDTAALLGPHLPQKALVTMRLFPGRGDIYLPQPNPLHCHESSPGDLR